MRTLLSVRTLQTLQPGQWVSDQAVRGAGQLQARKLKHGDIAFYYRYNDTEHKQVRLALGTGLTLAQARQKAAQLSRLYQEGERNLREHLAMSKADHEPQHSFGTLLEAYVEDLQRRGKTSTREIRNAIKLHIQKPFPQLWKQPAAAITTDDIMSIIRQVVSHGKLSQANKLRSYIRAAYSAAIKSKQDATSALNLAAIHISTNPARDISTISSVPSSKDRVLSMAELQAYWKHLCLNNTPASLLLQFHLLTGAQRIQQLGRCTSEDYDTEMQAIKLLDPKGRRVGARIHWVALIPKAGEVLQAIQANKQLNPHWHHTLQAAHNNSIQNTEKTQEQGTPRHYLWSVTAGQTGACYTTAAKELKSIVKQMQEANALPGGPFTLGDIRRTVETRLAALGISREIRAQLQSHGLSGVQVRHYDRHDYFEEKKDALIALYASYKHGSDRIDMPQEAQEPQERGSGKIMTIAHPITKAPLQVIISKRRKFFTSKLVANSSDTSAVISPAKTYPAPTTKDPTQNT
ncbi:MAG: tyrosine-type recombinase/integrase [Saezia sp.]